MQKKIRAVYMRGGTSKAVFFHNNHLPKDPAIRNRVILAAYGSPDRNRRQIDGMGGAVSTTSKVAIVSPSPDPDYDVIYNFGQVAIDKPHIDYQGNCGNISSAVGPFAVDEGLVPVQEPVTRVRIYQANTKKRIIAEVPVENGQYNETVTGKIVKEDQIDLVARIMSMGTLHKAYAATGAVCTAGAARIEGTVVNDMVKGKKLNGTIYLGHPGDIIDIGVKVEKKGDTFTYEEAIVGRTARRLMEGYVCVPERFFM